MSAGGHNRLTSPQGDKVCFTLLDTELLIFCREVEEFRQVDEREERVSLFNFSGLFKGPNTRCLIC